MKNKKILLSFLDWGVGHLTRSIPLIRLLEDTHHISVATTPQQENFLKSFFPNINYFRLCAYNIRYNKYPLFNVYNKFEIIYKVLKAIKREHLELVHILKRESFDLIISDNRYGFYSKKTPSIIITHQLQVRNNPIANFLISKAIKPFNSVWVPDFNIPNGLAGILTKGIHNRIVPINLLSRFHNYSIKNTYPLTDIFCIVSGPKPHHSKLLNILIKHLKATKFSAIITSFSEKNKEYGNIKVVNQLPDDEFAFRLKHTKLIVSRGGYSTLMDLAVYNKSSLIVPTPNQPEQKYLGIYHEKNNNHLLQSQKNLDLSDAFRKISTLKSTYKEDSLFLNKALISKEINILSS